MLKRIIFVITIIFFSCKKDFNNEQDFLNCIYSKNDQSVIQDAIFQHEVYFKSKGLIVGNTGKDYKKLIKEISQGQINLDQIGKTLAINVESLNLNVKSCGEKYSSQNSKAKQIKEVFEIMIKQEADIQKTLQRFNEIVDKKDLENPFYKICTFVIIDYYLIY